MVDFDKDSIREGDMKKYMEALMDNMNRMAENDPGRFISLSMTLSVKEAQAITTLLMNMRKGRD